MKANQAKLIEVKNLTMTIGDKSLTLTVAEAKALQGALNEAFPIPEKVRIVEKVEYRDRPYPVPRWRQAMWDRDMKDVISATPAARAAAGL